MFATLHTSEGDIRIELFPNQAPHTVKNFTGLATGEKTWTDPKSGEEKSGVAFYDGLIFHRVIQGFMIQGGCPLGTGTGGPGYDFDDEVSVELTFSKPYLLAMANAGKRMGRGTNGSQFFITVGPTPHLNMKHTIFAAGRRPDRRDPHRTDGPSGSRRRDQQRDHRGVTSRRDR